MKIIISPAKKIKKESEILFSPREPVFLKESQVLVDFLRSCSLEELKKLLVCNDNIAKLNYDRYQNMDCMQEYHALLAYDGIQYQYMSPLVFDDKCFNYVSKYLRILSGLYGMLHPLDSIKPYRLEMQTKLITPFCKDLYDFWGKSIADELTRDENLIINLASKEYSKIVEKYLRDDVHFVTCSFADVDNDTGKLVEKGVYVKMARGEMVRFMAENTVTDVESLKDFTGLGYSFKEEQSNESLLVFTR